jgi:hypothetical protein
MAQTQVTLTLPEDLYEHAQRWATITRKGLEETLTNALAIVLTPIQPEPELEQPVVSMSEKRLLAATKLQMQQEQGRRLDALLALQSEGRLAARQRGELQALMQLYDQLWLRQSEALAEAARRGLIDPIEP